jgi:hypothetical protein
MERVNDAIACFERALTLREIKGEGGLLTSTRRALDAARAIADGDGRVSGK